MTAERLSLRSGRRLQRHGQSWMLLPGERSVEVERDGNVVIVTCPESGKKFRDEVEDRPKNGPRKCANDPAGEAKGDDARDKARRRFATYNSFTDAVMRYVPVNAREVWKVFYRFADATTNAAELRVPDISARLGCDDRTVERGIKFLMVAGLITRLRRGTRQNGASQYVLDPDPARHLDKLRAMHEEREGKKRHRTGRPVSPTNRAKSGRFTTRHR